MGSVISVFEKYIGNAKNVGGKHSKKLAPGGVDNNYSKYCGVKSIANLWIPFEKAMVHHDR